MKLISLILLFILGTISSTGQDLDLTNHTNPPRLLRRRGRGRRGGRRSRYYRGTYSSQYKVRYLSKNTYLKKGRTYKPLYAYYRPLGYYHALGYYSILHAKIYYDGYGYNFYYGKYAYYENSPNDVNYVDVITTVLTIACMLFCIVFNIWGKYRDEEENQNKVQVIEKVVYVDLKGNRISRDGS